MFNSLKEIAWLLKLIYVWPLCPTKKNIKITVLTMEIKVNTNSEYLIRLLKVNGLGVEKNE